jgi:acetyl-CoA carboxylase biotin carboxyl carrier protein
MDLKKIQELIKFVSKSGVSEVMLEEKDFKITIKTGSKSDNSANDDNVRYVPHYIGMPQGMPAQPQQVQQPPPPQPQQPATDTQPAKEDKPKDDVPAENQKVIKAPMIGTFYRKPSPDKDVFVKPGDTIKKGDTVCIIEAMKLFNEIEAEFSGKIIKVLADDMSPVEYDQPLFLVEAE